jgi:hypothetical protein
LRVPPIARAHGLPSPRAVGEGIAVDPESISVASIEPRSVEVETDEGQIDEGISEFR